MHGTSEVKPLLIIIKMPTWQMESQRQAYQQFQFQTYPMLQIAQNITDTKKSEKKPFVIATESLKSKKKFAEPLDTTLVDEAQIMVSLALREHYKTQLNRLERVIAIVIDDLGVDQKRSLRAVNLEGVYTLSFLTYGKNLSFFNAIALENGHEIFIHQGAEPLSKIADPGPGALRLNMNVQEIRQQIANALLAIPNAKGLNTHMGSQFNQWLAGVDIMVEEINSNGLIYLDSFTHKSSQAFYRAYSKNYPSLGRDVFLDGDTRSKAIKIQLQRTQKIADKQGFAIAIGHPRDNTLTMVPQWQKHLLTQGYQFVTISQLWQLLTKNNNKTINENE